MKKMTVSEMQKKNGGYTYRCSCGWTTQSQFLYNTHINFFCNYRYKQFIIYKLLG